MVDFFKHADKILIYWCVNENYFVEISKIQFGEREVNNNNGGDREHSNFKP